MKKLIFFLPSLKGGGAERVALNLVREASANSYEVTVVVTNAVGVLYDDFNKCSTIIDLKKSRVLYSLFPLISTIKKLKPEVIISMMDHCNIILVLAKMCLIGHPRIILTVHNNLDINLKKNSLLKRNVVLFFVKLLYRFGDKIVTVSNGVKESLINYLPLSIIQKISVIYNPCLDKSIILKAGEDFVMPWEQEDVEIICAVGRLTEQKGFDVLIEAFSLVATTRHNARLIILGIGEEEKKLQAIIRSKNLELKVFLLGFQLNPYKYIQRSNVFAFSSKWEGFGVVLVEALYLKKHIVSTDCDFGPREILENGRFGTLVKVDDVKEFSNALIHKLKIKERENHVPDEYLQKFTTSTIFGQYETLWL